MRAYRGFVIGISLAVALMRPSPAAAQPSSSSLPVLVGQKVRVTVADGRIITGRVSLLTPASIELAGTSIATRDVRRVQVPDSLRDGIEKGAVLCGLLGLTFG